MTISTLAIMEGCWRFSIVLKTQCQTYVAFDRWHCGTIVGNCCPIDSNRIDVSDKLGSMTPLSVSKEASDASAAELAAFGKTMERSVIVNIPRIVVQRRYDKGQNSRNVVPIAVNDTPEFRYREQRGDWRVFVGTIIGFLGFAVIYWRLVNGGWKWTRRIQSHTETKVRAEGWLVSPDCRPEYIRVEAVIVSKLILRRRGAGISG